MAPYQALTTLRAERKRLSRLGTCSCYAVRQYQSPPIRAKFFEHENAESAVSDLAPSRPEGTLSQVRHHALGVSVIETELGKTNQVPNQQRITYAYDAPPQPQTTRPTKPLSHSNPSMHL